MIAMVIMTVTTTVIMGIKPSRTLMAHLPTYFKACKMPFNCIAADQTNGDKNNRGEGKWDVD